MALSFAQLTTPTTQGQWNTLLLNALSGVGIISPAGPNNAQGQPTASVGTGSVSYVSGVPNATYSVVLKITISGEPGTGSFQYSTDGGGSFSSNVGIPSAGTTYTVPGTGVTVLFSAGPTGSGTSFVANDTYSFSLSVPNFPVSAWEAGGTARTLVSSDAQALASLSNLVALIAAGGLVNYASGPWLDLCGINVYNLARNQAVATQGNVKLTDTANAGPFNVAAGAMTVASGTGLLYSNIAGFTIPKNGNVTTTFQASAAGAAYNAADGSITSIVGGSLPGVTASNAGPNWITQQGSDKETDQAYAARCVARWPSLGTGATAATYDLWARTASPNITRTAVAVDTVNPGQVDIFLAGPSGGSGGSDVTAANNYIQPRTPLGIVANVAAATNVPITILATVTYRSAVTTLTLVQAGINTNITALFNSARMGIDAGGSVKLYLDQIRAAILNVTGVVNSEPVSSPAGDTALTLGQVPTIAGASNIGTTWAGWTFTGI